MTSRPLPDSLLSCDPIRAVRHGVEAPPCITVPPRRSPFTLPNAVAAPGGWRARVSVYNGDGDLLSRWESPEVYPSLRGARIASRRKEATIGATLAEAA